jgi:hypothetical protein
MEKLYCYVDETGQDTQGKLFLVAVVILEKAVNDELRGQLLAIERRVGKRRARWAQNRLPTRQAYLERILSLPALRDSIWYAAYPQAQDYIALTGRSIATAIRTRAHGPYRATIEIDGFNETELAKVRKALKAARVTYEKIRGWRDESLVFIRLADALAGFLRDAEEGQPYTRPFLTRFQRQRFLHKLP